MAKVIKKTDMPDGSVVLELDTQASPPEFFDLMRSAGLEPFDGCEITGGQHVQVFNPKVQGAAPVVQTIGKPSIIIRWKNKK